MPPLTLRLAEKCPRSVQVRDTPHRQHLTISARTRESLGPHSTLKTTTAGEKATQGNLPGGLSGTNGGLAVPSRDLSRSEKKPPPLLSTRTRRLPGPGLGPGLPHVPCSPLRARRTSSAKRAGHTLPEGTPAAVLAGPRVPSRVRSVPSSRSPPQPAHLAQLLPLRQRLEGEALVALGAGVERRHVRPGPFSPPPLPPARRFI